MNLPTSLTAINTYIAFFVKERKNPPRIMQSKCCERKIITLSRETFHFSIISQCPIISLIEQNTNFQEKIKLNQASF